MRELPAVITLQGKAYLDEKNRKLVLSFPDITKAKTWNKLKFEFETYNRRTKRRG